MKLIVSKQVIEEIKYNLSGNLYGRIDEQKSIVQVLKTEETFKDVKLNKIGSWGDSSYIGEGLWVKKENNVVEFYYNSEKLEPIVFDSKDYDLRNRSEILSENLKGKKAFLVSCGSVNSRIGYELAKHGVQVTIVDPDVIEIHNCYRFGLQDIPEFMVGYSKVAYFKKKVEQNIPNAKVNAFQKDFVEDISFFDELLQKEKPDLIIIGTDTENSKRDSGTLAYQLKIPALFVTLADKAESGQILYLSGNSEDSCYNCFSSSETLFKTKETNHQYGIQENEQRAVPALSVDISIISAIATKLAMVILAEQNISEYMKNFDNKGNIMWLSTKPDTWVFENAFQVVVAQLQKNLNCTQCK